MPEPTTISCPVSRPEPLTGGGVCGTDPGLRADLEDRRIGYVQALGCDRRVGVDDGRTLIGAGELAERIGTAEWQVHSCGRGAKGPRGHLWTWVTTVTPANLGRLRRR
ncbi:hypothetical protein [Polymorphospora sp. NPDC050346]|uniref:hypothetical protein n=1 Tax=Polymorphospora sp. NPDC050346 TaxID=3155780 RepID=UPI0033C4F0B5